MTIDIDVLVFIYIYVYHQHTKYLKFDWLMNTKYFAYLKAAYFSSNLIGCQLKITLILTAAPPLFLSLLFVDVAADFESWMFLSRIFCTLMINMLWKARLWIINRLLDTLSINMGEISSSSLYFVSPKGSPKYGKTR